MDRARIIGAFVLLAVLSAGVGCSQKQYETIRMPCDEAVALTAMDVARVMHNAGFSYEQIYEQGTDLRNALAQQGASRIKKNGHTVAIFAVKDNAVYVSSRLTGSFIYDMDKRKIK